MTTILAIETSCDETGVGIARLDGTGPGATVTLLADEVASSVDEHVRFGGVVPEIASRAHLEALGPTMRRALTAAGLDKPGQKPDIVAATIGPGLAGALLVGAAAAKAYAAAWGVPFYAVNHLGGHLAADVYDHGPLPECVALLVLRRAHPPVARAVASASRSPSWAAPSTTPPARPTTRWPGCWGWATRAARCSTTWPAPATAAAITFPRGMTGPADDPHAFSFSGLKTAVARYVESHPDAETADIAAGFQEAVADVLTMKAARAATRLGVSTLLIAGGVAANSRLRELAVQRCAAAGLTLRIPRPRLCTDNGAMIASFAAHLVVAGAAPSPLDAPTDPGLPVVKGLVS